MHHINLELVKVSTEILLVEWEYSFIQPSIVHLLLLIQVLIPILLFLLGEEKLIQLLLKSGVNINAVDNHKDTSLHLATKNGHEKVVQILLENGANVNAEGKYVFTPLHLATLEGKLLH